MSKNTKTTPQEVENRSHPQLYLLTVTQPNETSFQTVTTKNNQRTNVNNIYLDVNQADHIAWNKTGAIKTTGKNKHSRATGIGDDIFGV